MNLIRHKNFRKRPQPRVALAIAALTLALALLSTGCSPPETSSTGTSANANVNTPQKPTVTITQGTAPQPTPVTNVIPAEVLNIEIQPVDGKPFRLADFKDKVVVLNLWATWCGPCRYEIPHLVELKREYASKGVEVIGLTTENPNTSADAVRDFAEEFKINYRLGWATADLARALMSRPSIPQNFVIAPGGRVVAHYVGFSDRVPEMIRASIDKANGKAAE